MAGDASLATRLERLPGVGTARAEKLVKLGLVTVRDALMHFPREYRDFSGAHAFTGLREGERVVVGGAGFLADGDKVRVATAQPKR